MTRNGFTLVELMVALLIFGLLSAAGVAMLSFGIEARASSEVRFDAVAATLRTRTLLTTDLAQAASRPYRRIDGSVAPAFGPDGDAALAFVRRGWTNDEGAPRASLQRVEYRLREGRLERVAFPMIDGAQPGPPTALLTGVRTLGIRFRTKGEWRDRWDGARLDAMPQAIEMVIEADDAHELRQLFLVGVAA